MCGKRAKKDGRRSTALWMVLMTGHASRSGSRSLARNDAFLSPVASSGAGRPVRARRRSSVATTARRRRPGSGVGVNTAFAQPVWRLRWSRSFF